MTNSGRPMKAREVTEMTWSVSELRRRAASRPMRMPRGTYMRKATRASMAEFLRREKTSPFTELSVLSDMPQSPRTKLASQLKY